MNGGLSAMGGFFATIGGGAAALLGLLFVAVSINVKEVVAHDDTRELARHTFVTFVGVLLYALFALLPQSIQDLGIDLMIGSAVFIVFTGPRFVRSFFGGIRTLSRRLQVLRYGLALILQVFALAIGVDMLLGDSRGVVGLISVEIVMLLGGARNAWEILIEMGRPSSG